MRLRHRSLHGTPQRRICAPRLARVLAEVEKGHAAHILRKLGFHHVSDEQIPHSDRIISLYELSREDWQWPPS